MKYTVITQSDAVADAENIRADLEAVSPDYADRWIDELEAAEKSLASFPNRFPQAPESRRSVSHFEGHAQEIIAMTRQIKGDAYKFLWTPKTPEQIAASTQNSPREKT